MTSSVGSVSFQILKRIPRLGNSLLKTKKKIKMKNLYCKDEDLRPLGMTEIYPNQNLPVNSNSGPTACEILDRPFYPLVAQF